MSMAFFALAASILVVCAGVGFIIPLLPVYSQNIGATGIWVGIIIGSDPLIRAVLGMFFGRLAEAKGMKRFLVFGLIGYALVALGFSTATAPWHLLIWRVLQGVSGSMVFPASQAYAGALTPQGKEGRVMALFNLFFMTGFAIGPLTGGLLMQYLGPSGPFMGLSALSVLALLLICIFLPERKLLREGGQESISFRRLLKDRVVQLIVYSVTFMAAIWGVFMTLLPLWGSVNLGLSAGIIGMLISLWSVVEAVLQPAFGILADRAIRYKLVLLGLAVAPFSLYLVTVSMDAWHLAGVMVLLAMTGGIMGPTVAAIAVERGRVLGMGSVMGIRGASMGLGMSLGGFLGGLGADLVGIVMSFRIFTGMAVAAGLFFALMVWGNRAISVLLNRDEAA